MYANLFAGKTILFGFLCWLIPFFGAFPIVAFKDKRPMVFKTLMALILAASSVALARSFFLDARITDGMQGLVIGLFWAAICIAIDLPMFLKGFKMKPATYLSEIGIAYLMIPVITWADATLLAGVAR